MPTIPGPTRVLNRNELAAFHGVSVMTVDTWVKAGCPAIERGSRGKNYRFDSGAVIAWRIAQARNDAVAGLVTETGAMSREEADRRRAVAGATVAEIEAATALKSVALVAHVEEDVLAFCTSLHTGIGNACNKIAGRAASMTSAPEIEDLCHAELNRAFASAKAALAEKWAAAA